MKEEEILKNSISILQSNIIETDNDKELYMKLVEDYKELLEQMKRMVKMSDIMENKLNYVRRSIDEISKVDFLTNLYNRRHFYEVLEKAWRDCEKNKKYLSVLMIDIDNFKEYNDRYGHVNGDRCLKGVSECIKDLVQQFDNIVARYGGEELIVLLPDSDSENAKYMAEEIRKNIEKLEILHEDSKDYEFVTVSIGSATTIPSSDLLPEKLIIMADEALYRAKKSGRNRVCI